jgi:hypothetical protein
MPKLPERFIKADIDSPCEKCEKVRATCRFCEKCKDCCDCPICSSCGGAEGDKACDHFIKDVGHECNCEMCAGWPQKGCFGKIDKDFGNYIDNPNGGCSLMYCDKCYKKLPQSLKQ